MGELAPASLAGWLSQERTGAVVGHVDTLALPPLS
jgi:hypothetical protein